MRSDGQRKPNYARASGAVRDMHLIALGANLPSPLGGPRATLEAALAALAAAGLAVAARSGWFRTPAFPAGSGPDYVNGAAALAAALAPGGGAGAAAGGGGRARAAAGGALGAAGLRSRPSRQRRERAARRGDGARMDGARGGAADGGAAAG